MKVLVGAAVMQETLNLETFLNNLLFTLGCSTLVQHNYEDINITRTPGTRPVTMSLTWVFDSLSSHGRRMSHLIRNSTVSVQEEVRMGGVDPSRSDKTQPTFCFHSGSRSRS